MKYSDAAARLADYRRQIAAIRTRMRETQEGCEPQEVRDYEFQTPEGPVRLSQLFGPHQQLILIHNMGTKCPNCTMWADGYNGIHDHVASRVGFVISSPDPPELQRQFAASRGWKFRMVSHAGTTFAADMGFRTESGGWRPGVSVFQRQGGRIVRVSEATFSPGDDFCTVWHLFDLLPGGAADWQPRFRY
jgi:predicted dithiol-disulfide oxidoreductase (DUF899 family)